jgi:hypothetical protein
MDVCVSLPNDLSVMVKLAEELSREIPFLRVDFYYVNQKMYAGELTFFPGSGLLPFSDEKWDITMGNWLTLPEKKTK